MSGVTYGAQDKGGRRPTPLDSVEKQRYLEWLLTPPSERQPGKLEDLASELGLSRRTLTKWRTEDKDFMEAWEARYLATVGSPERKQELLDRLYKTGKDEDDPKHVQAIKAYFDITEGMRPQRMQLEVTRSPIDLTDEELAEVFAHKVIAERAVREEEPAE